MNMAHRVFAPHWKRQAWRIAAALLALALMTTTALAAGPPLTGVLSNVPAALGEYVHVAHTAGAAPKQTWAGVLELTLDPPA